MTHKKTYSVLFTGDRGESEKKDWTALSAQKRTNLQFQGQISLKK